MLDVMNLEAQLLAEIEERTIKLEKIRGVSPKLQALENLLGECKAACDEFGMQDLFLGVLGNFTAATKTPTLTPTPKENTKPTPDPIQKLSDKEAKAIRTELKTFLEYEGQRLNDATAKELLIKKCESNPDMVGLLSAVNLDDKVNFLTEAKKLITLLPHSKEEVKEEETLTPNLTTPTEEVKEEDVLTPNLTTPTEEVKEEDVLKGALVQNLINGFYGTIEQDGVINSGAMVRYPSATELTPLINLKLISPAIFTPTPIIPVIEEIKEEEEIKDMTPQDKAMWDVMLEIFDSAEELSAMATDPETIANFNLANGTNLNSLPIADLYEYTTGSSRIQ